MKIVSLVGFLMMSAPGDEIAKQNLLQNVQQTLISIDAAKDHKNSEEFKNASDAASMFLTELKIY